MKVLILENDAELHEDYSFSRYVRKMEKDGHEVQYIFNAYSSAPEIIKKVNWPDVIAFTSTFIYIHSIYELAQAIGKYRKEPLEMHIMAENVSGNIGRLVKLYAEVPIFDGEDKNGNPMYYYKLDEERAEQFGHKLQHISIFDIPYSIHDTIDKKPVTVLSDLAAKWQAKLDFDKTYLESRMSEEAYTGRMIRIRGGLLKSCPGKKWENLKPGMVVPEISMLGASERIAGKMTDRGAWVMGVGEPVKVLNSEGHDEFEYVVRSYEDLALDILKMCGKELSSKNFFYVNGVLKDTSEDLTPHWKATMILDEFGVPRRGHRDRMEKKIADFEATLKVPA